MTTRSTIIDDTDWFEVSTLDNVLTVDGVKAIKLAYETVKPSLSSTDYHIVETLKGMVRKDGFPSGNTYVKCFDGEVARVTVSE